MGYQVVSYEPDTNHAEIAKSYLKGYANHSFHRCAVSSYDGKATFTRILNNTTGSYINDKRESYGPTVVYEVDVVNASHLSGQYDLFKLDVEGSEVDILSSFNQEDFQVSDFIVEISSPVSRYNFWQIFSKNKIPVYSQKNSWEKVRVMEQLPTSHKEGSVFISSKNTWS